MSQREEIGGLYGKFHGLRRTRDNAEVEAPYFVLIPEKEDGSFDAAAIVALEAYADACGVPELASDLRGWAKECCDLHLAQGLYDANWER